MHYVAKVEGKRFWDKSEDIETIVSDMIEHKENITGIELSSNSIGLEAAKGLAQEIKNLINLETVNYRDIFVSRLRADLPKSLFELVNAITDKNIKILDLSDNALGPVGVEAFGFFLEKTNSLKELYIENTGLGPEGAEMLANILLKNDNLKLEVLVINRNRLENKGAMAFAK